MGEAPSLNDIRSFGLPNEHIPPDNNFNNAPKPSSSVSAQQNLQGQGQGQQLPGSSVGTPSSATSQRFIMDFNSVDEYTTEGLRRIIEATKAFQSLPPAGPIWDLQKSYPEFSRAMKNCRTRILPIIKSLLDHSKVSTRDFKRRDLEEKFDFIVDSNDDILERIATALDEASGLFKRTEILIVNPNKAGTGKYTLRQEPWGKRKTVDTHDSEVVTVTNKNKRPRVDEEDDDEEKSKTDEKDQEAGTENRPVKKALHRLRVTEKPQIHFKTPIDNSFKPFVPKLKDKPNSLKPLSILPEYNAKNEEFYGHPYNVELIRWEPDEKFMNTVEPQIPLPMNQVPVQLVSTVNELEEMLKVLRSVDEIGVDLEHHAFRTFLGLTCTIQISTRANDYVIDALALREDLECLNEIFTKPKVIKIFHGALSDVDWLQRDFGLYLVGLFDTHVAAKTLGLSGLSLQYLLEHYCKINVDKTYQLADWRIRPLPADMIEYCRQDTHYLLYLYDLLKNELIKNGNQFKNLLTSVYDQSKNLCLRRYEKPTNNPELALRKTRRQLNNRQLYAFTHLYKWRDAMAREKDESLNYILPSHMLLMISEALPKEMTGILSCCDPVPPLVQNNLGDLHRIILQARDLPLHEEKIQMGGTEKRKKLKNWVVMLNSIHDVNISELMELGEDEENIKRFNEFENIRGGEGDNSTNRQRSRMSWSEPFNIDTIDMSGIKLKTTPSSKIFARQYTTSNNSVDNKVPINKNGASSAYERYQLSNEIIEMLKDPKKKEQLDLEDPLVRVVYDTLVADPEENRKLMDPNEDEGAKETPVGKILPDSDFVPFNPMAAEYETFKPPAKKKAKKSRNTHEPWNDGEEYKETSLPKDYVGTPDEPDGEDGTSAMDTTKSDHDDEEIMEEFKSVPLTKSKKRKNNAKFLEHLKLKKLMKLKKKKKHELEQLEKNELQSKKDKNKSPPVDDEDDIIEIGSRTTRTSSKDKDKSNNHDSGRNKNLPSKKKKDKSRNRGSGSSAGKILPKVVEPEEEVICLDDDDDRPPRPPSRKPKSSQHQRQIGQMDESPIPPISVRTPIPHINPAVLQPSQRMFNPLSIGNRFASLAKKDGQTDKQPPATTTGRIHVNPNFNHGGKNKFLNQFRRKEGKSITFK